MFFVYILFSISGHRFYIGQTNDIVARLIRHNTGKVISTKNYRPWILILVLSKSTRSEAMMLEKKLKNLNTDDLVKFIKKYS